MFVQALLLDFPIMCLPVVALKPKLPHWSVVCGGIGTLGRKCPEFCYRQQISLNVSLNKILFVGELQKNVLT